MGIYTSNHVMSEGLSYWTHVSETNGLISPKKHHSASVNVYKPAQTCLIVLARLYTVSSSHETNSSTLEGSWSKMTVSMCHADLTHSRFLCRGSHSWFCVYSCNGTLRACTNLFVSVTLTDKYSFLNKCVCYWHIHLAISVGNLCIT